MDSKTKRTAGYVMIGAYILVFLFFLIFSLVGHHPRLLLIGLPALTPLLLLGMLLLFTRWPNSTKKP